MGIKQEFIEKIQYEDLTEDFKLVADTCGIETARTLIIELGGIRLDIPTAKSLRESIKRYINNRSESVPIKKIALELGCSERYLQKLEERDKLF
jgi:hypothetical protein